MKTMWLVARAMALGIAGVAVLAVMLRAEPPAAGRGARVASTSGVDAKDRVPVDVARDRAKTMHDIYTASLDMMHHRYFHRDKAVVPARAMEDVFSEIRRKSSVEARWISVNMKAMSIDHEPETDFEKKAAREIADGKSDIEMVEAGYYRRAGAIPLAGGCISCHGGFFTAPSKTPKYAGLIISIPILDQSPKPQ